MKLFISFVLGVILASPISFYYGYSEGSFNQRTLDSISKSRLVAKIAELYESDDKDAYTLIYTYLGTELSMFEEFLDYGTPSIARLTFHDVFIDQSHDHVVSIREYLNANPSESSKYKKEAIESLDRIGRKLP